MSEAGRRNSYTTGSIGGTMIRTAFSMLPATLAMSGYNIADTFFVARLGTTPLAAMGFSFPVIMLVNCVYHGLGVGVMTTVAQALGGGRTAKAARIITAGLLLIAVVSVLVGMTGIACLDWTFAQFGATGEVLKPIRAYMMIWYLFGLTGSLGMAGNDLLIAAGDSKIASTVMCGGMIVNVALDPLLIFGWGGIPGLGIQGAAIATVASQMVTAVIAIGWLYERHRLLTWAAFQWRLFKHITRLVTRFAVPATIGMLMMPIGNGVVTKIIAGFGDAAVAATAAAGRIEAVAFVFPMSLGITLLPMVGQNYGAYFYRRINQCRRFSMRFALYFELVMAVIYFLAAPRLAGFFSDDPEVVKIMVWYLRIIPVGFGLIEIHRYSGFFFTGCGKPGVSAWLNALRILGLMVPFSLLALYFKSLIGVFAARLAADVIAGSVGWAAAHYLTSRLPADAVSSAPKQGSRMPADGVPPKAAPKRVPGAESVPEELAEAMDKVGL